MSEEPTALNAGGKDGIVGAVPSDGADGVPPEPPDGAVFPANVGTLVFVIDFLQIYANYSSKQEKLV